MSTHFPAPPTYIVRVIPRDVVIFPSCCQRQSVTNKPQNLKSACDTIYKTEIIATEPFPIATSGGASRPTVTRYSDGSALIEAPGNTCHVPADLVAPLRRALLEIDAEHGLPAEDGWCDGLPEGLSILVGNDGEVVILVRGWEHVAIGTEDLACVAGGLG